MDDDAAGSAADDGGLAGEWARGGAAAGAGELRVGPDVVHDAAQVAHRVAGQGEPAAAVELPGRGQVVALLERADEPECDLRAGAGRVALPEQVVERLVAGRPGP